MESVPEHRGVIGVPAGSLTFAQASEICQLISNHMQECAAVLFNDDEQCYEFQIPVGDVTRTNMICYCTGLTDIQDENTSEEDKDTSANEVISQTEALDRQPMATANVVNGQTCAPMRNSQRSRVIRERRYNAPYPKNHIPRPRNSWIIYRSDKTRELRDMDSSLTASDISRITSRLWAEELPHVKARYQQRAQEEANAHMLMYPDYRYRARRPIPRQPKVDAMMFWDGHSTQDAQNSDDNIGSSI